jgi:hypothetical protein
MNKPKVDLIVVGAVINEDEEHFITAAIESIREKYEFNKKFIVIDGLKSDTGYGDKFLTYNEFVRFLHPDFDFKIQPQCIYFKEILLKTLKRSDADYVLIIQDDVVAPKNIDIDEDLKFFNDNPDCKLLSYPHKIIPDEGTHWFSPLEKKGKYMKTHGWCERIFLAKREQFYYNILTERVRGKKANLFCDYIYHNTMNREKRKGELPSDEYWKSWGIYIKNDNIHSHLVAHRPKGHSHTSDSHIEDLEKK